MGKIRSVEGLHIGWFIVIWYQVTREFEDAK